MNQSIDRVRIAARGFRTLSVPALFLLSACADRVSAPSAAKGDAPLPGFFAVSAPRLSVIGPPLMRSDGERTFLFRDGTSYSVLTADGNLIPGAAIPGLIKSASTTGQFLGDFAISSSPAWGIFYSAKMNHVGTNSYMKTSLTYLVGGETIVTMESEPVPGFSPRALVCWIAITPLPACTAHDEQTQTRLFSPLPAICGSSATLKTDHRSWVFINTEKPLPFPAQSRETYDHPSPGSLSCTPKSSNGDGGGAGSPEGYTLYTFEICDYEATFAADGHYLYTTSLGCRTTQIAIPKGTVYAT
jgi:hypothetical protein